MKQLILLLSIVLLSCGRPSCPEGQYYDCGRGCVDIPKNTVTVEVPAKNTPAVVQEELPPVPKYTKFQISDIVCVWSKDTGVVIGIHWGHVPEGHDPVLVYTVQFYDPDTPNSDFYDTELTKGKCE